MVEWRWSGVVEKDCWNGRGVEEWSRGVGGGLIGGVTDGN